ncbi:hypothetical protein JOL79_24720 [Microbispora sp. RL4-1S]|uniref:Uncharacterized protein n=1 Tax=Microbispora oryzae TaxID=2806554 RepID=A0A941AS01_9ACTN|nr:hypothetical protein [Microbispora oryzae]MBP2706994.1 hypothetical protein [Microbispora oryzae]
MSPGQATAVGAATGPLPGGPGQPNPSQVHCAVTLQRIYGWLQASLPQTPQLAAVIPLIVQAVRLYRTGQFEACLSQVQYALAVVSPGQPIVPLL